MPTLKPHGAIRRISLSATLSLSVLVSLSALLPAPVARAQEECDRNLDFTSDFSSLDHVVGHFVTVESAWGNIYVMLRRGGDTWLIARGAQNILDNDPGTPPTMTLLDSVQIASSTPPVAFDLLEVGAGGFFGSDRALIAMGASGVGAIEAEGTTLGSGTIDVIPLPGFTWDVAALPVSDQLAHVYTASGPAGLHLLDLNAAGGEMELLSSFPLPGDSRGVEVYLSGPDTLVFVANGHGVQVLRSDATRPSGFDVADASPSSAVLDSRENRVLFVPGAAFTDVSIWTLGLDRYDWAPLPTTGPFPPSRIGADAMFDSLNNRLLYCGGGPWFYPTGTEQVFTVPWSLDLSTQAWTSLDPAVPPPDLNPRRNAAVEFDPDRNRLVVFGGDWPTDFSGLDINFEYGGQTWAFDLGTHAWSDLTPASPDPTPSARSGMAHIFLPGNANRPDRMLIHGGKFADSTGVLIYDDVWVFDLEHDRWYRPLTRGVPPALLANHGAFFDPEGDRVLVFGDTLGSGSVQPGTVYTLALADSAPEPFDLLGHWTAFPPPFIEFPPRMYFAGVYDAARQGVLTIGGQDSARYHTDLNFLDGDGYDWSRVIPEILTFVDSLATGGSAEDLARWGDTVFVAEGLEGVAVVHAGAILDPSGTDPVLAVVGTLPVEGHAHEVEVEGNYLYVAARTGGVQVFDAASPESGVVANYGRLDHVEAIQTIGWGQHAMVPVTTHAFAFVADEEALTVLRHDAVDVSAPAIAVAPVEKAGLPGRFSAYAVASECLADTLFADEGLRSRFMYAYLEASVIVRDSTAFAFSPVEVLDPGERLYATQDLIDIRDGLDDLAESRPTLIADSLRLELSWQARDLAGNQGTGSERVAVGTLLGEIGGALRAIDPAIWLTVPAESFAGRGHFYFLEEHRLDRGEGAEGGGASGLIIRYPDPAAQGLQVAGASCRVGWTVVPGGDGFELALPLASDERREGAGDGTEIAVYRLDGDRWSYVGGRSAEGEVVARVNEPGVYAALRGSGMGPGLLAAGLDQNAPNPFNPFTVIRYRLPEAAYAALRVYDVHGRAVRTLFEGPREAGEGVATWDGNDDTGRPAGAGVYFYRLDTERGDAASRKMILAR